MSLPFSSSSPADSKEKLQECLDAGAAMRNLLELDLKPRDIMTKVAFENAISMIMMTGGSTNAVLHLIAMSRSCQDPDVAISLDDFQRISDKVRTKHDTFFDTPCLSFYSIVCLDDTHFLHHNMYPALF
jgi:dihydroxy-acid dehydratase